MSKREVLLVVEQSMYYYIDDPDGTLTDEQAYEQAVKMLDAGEPDQNPGFGWLHVKRHEVNTLEDDADTDSKLNRVEKLSQWPSSNHPSKR